MSLSYQIFSRKAHQKTHKGLFGHVEGWDNAGSGVLKDFELDFGRKLWYVDEAEGEVWGVPFVRLLICTLPGSCGVNLAALGSDTWDHSWEMEQDKCGDSQKLLHRAKDSDMASLAGLNTSSPHRGTSCFTSPSRAARNRPKNTLTASAR